MPIKLTIFRKGLILVAVPLLFQLALIGVVVEMQRQTAEAMHRLSVHFPAAQPSKLRQSPSARCK